MRRFLALFGMKFKPYRYPEKVGGWMGRLETKRGKCLGFIHQDGRICFDW